MIFKVLLTLLVTFVAYSATLDTTQKPQKVEEIFCLGGEGTDRIRKAVELLSQGYSKNKKVYYFANKAFFYWNVRKDDIFTKKLKKYDNQIIFIENATNTMDELNYIESKMKNNNKNIIIITDPPHSKRVDFMINNFTESLKNKYIIVSSGVNWWKGPLNFNYKALEFTIKEILKLPYNYIKYSFYV